MAEFEDTVLEPPVQKPPALQIKNLKVAVEKDGRLFEAVRGISFEIARGEIAGLAGESGCGKTLTALSLAQLLPEKIKITEGEIAFRPAACKNGPAAVLNRLGEKEMRKLRGKEISVIFQEARQALNPLAKAGPQIAEALELHGLKDKKQRAALALCELEKLGFAEAERIFNAYPHELSGGMCQRVMIAASSICRPSLIIADEPTTSLDPENSKLIISHLGGLNRDFNTAVFFISHDLSAMRDFCRKIIVMYAGKIAEEGPAVKIFSTPSHPYTKGLLAAIPGAHVRGRPLASIPGKIPPVTDRQAGCPFAPRCPSCLPRCLRDFPPQADLGGGHSVNCFLYGADSGAGKDG